MTLATKGIFSLGTTGRRKISLSKPDLTDSWPTTTGSLLYLPTLIITCSDLNLTTLPFYLNFPLCLTLFSKTSRIGPLDMSRFGPGMKTTTSRSRKIGSTVRELSLNSSKLLWPLCINGGIKDLALFLKESRLFKKI
jgi:hypothetical protein